MNYTNVKSSILQKSFEIKILSLANHKLLLTNMIYKFKGKLESLPFKYKGKLPYVNCYNGHASTTVSYEFTKHLKQHTR